MRQGLTISIVIWLGLGGPVPAEEGTIEVDRNGDGYMTLGEVQAVFPQITADVFSVMDANKDGALDDSEMVTGQEKGLIPVSIGG